MAGRHMDYEISASIQMEYADRASRYVLGIYWQYTIRLLNVFTIAHEAAAHTARLRVELSQSKTEQRDYLKQVELARVLVKREERKRKREEETGVVAPAKAPRAQPERAARTDEDGGKREKKRQRGAGPTHSNDHDLADVIGQIF